MSPDRSCVRYSIFSKINQPAAFCSVFLRCYSIAYVDADIVIEMETPRGPELTRRRAFRGVGRYPETLQSVSAELNPEGTDYVMLDADSSPHPPLLTTLQALLRASSTPLSRQEILSRWPESEPPPRADSLWRCLTRGCETGLFTRNGEGTKTEAFRYGVRENQPAEGRLG